MKLAVYIENGVTQFVLTPEDEFEQRMVAGLEKKNIEAKLNVGSFFACQGGWQRNSLGLSQQRDDRSLIVQVVEAAPRELAEDPVRIALERLVRASEARENLKAQGITDDTVEKECWDAMKQGQKAL